MDCRLAFIPRLQRSSGFYSEGSWAGGPGCYISRPWRLKEFPGFSHAIEAVSQEPLAWVLDKTNLSAARSRLITWRCFPDCF
ncbi:MAG TPA: hypothetical protein DHU55_16255 [Blastocatellia bacterium]|jgi:hypothetical protein|nr:hypothetical protein [Blastocatellia bacterium]HAF22631.1 hypothetical protein [Blastocatellia bacterium]HCX31299.1 hypothetical protein [Blastocatellia bacterium]